MSKVKNIIVGTLLTGVLLGSLTACTPDATTPSKNVGKNLASVCEVKMSAEKVKALGDAVPKTASTDEYGKYCKLGVNTSSPNVKFDASKIDDTSFELYGFNEEDAEQAQAFTLKWVIEQHLDSSRLDNYTVPADEWFTDFSDLFFDGVDDVVKEKGLVDTGIIVTDVFADHLTRDGLPRAKSIKVTVNKIEAFLTEGSKTPSIRVSVSAEASYPASDKLIVDTALNNNEGLTVEQIKSYSPELFDEKDESGFVVNANYRFTLDKGNLEQFSGLFSEWDLSSYEGKVIIN